MIVGSSKSGSLFSGSCQTKMTPNCSTMGHERTQAAAGKFSGDAVASFVKKSGIAEKIAHKKIIIPGYAASISGDMEEELPGWEVIIGPRDASLIPKFLKERVK